MDCKPSHCRVLHVIEEQSGSPASTKTDWGTHAPHLNPADDHSIYPAAVNGTQLDASDHAQQQRHFVVVDNRVRKGGVLKAAVCRGSEFKTVTAAGKNTVVGGRGILKRIFVPFDRPGPLVPSPLIYQDLVLRHIGVMDELTKHGKNCLRRGIDLIVDIRIAGVTVIAVHLQRNHLVLGVACGVASVVLVVVDEAIFPGLPVALRACECLNRPWVILSTPLSD